MGNEVSNKEKQEKNILRSPNVGQASDLYWASRAGDADAVKQILASTPFDDLNHLEPNGSTALHAAAFFGHADVVRILLQERGVMRHRKNRHDLTAYEEAANDEIRQLFHRLNSTRFCKNSIDDGKNLFTFPTDQTPEDDENADELTDAWIAGYKDDLMIRAGGAAVQVMKVIASSSPLRFMAHKLFESDDDQVLFSDEKIISVLQELIDKYVTSDHPEYDKACKLLSNYGKTKKAEQLLHLYSLETPFYCHLDDNNHHLWSILIYRLSSLKGRAFKGRSYRGLSMTKTDLKAYRWAQRNKGSIIITQSFCSTSIDEAVARGFVSTSRSEKLSVLMIFDFPQPCDTAIQLYTLSKDLPCISEFENEREVLLLPFIFFNVINITNEDSSGHYTIHLENVLPKMDWSALWTAMREK